MQVAITGSSGFIGSALAARLAGAGADVLRVRRGDPADGGAHWSPQEGWFRPGALEGVDAVVHLTGVSVGARRWTARRREVLRSSRVDATRTLVDHLRTLTRRPRVLVTASAIGYYGCRGDETLTEASSSGDGFLADLVRDWEAEAARASELGIRMVYARFAPILSMQGELMQKLLPPFKMGVGGRLGSGRQRFSWVTLEDAVEAVAFAVERDSLSGPVNVSAPGALTNAEFTKALGRALHRPTLFPLPSPMLKLVFGSGRANETLLASQHVVPEKLTAAGFAFADREIGATLERLLQGRPVERGEGIAQP
ncbi:MAG: TIGR01777 family protein [Chloroflexi bacterium]|nr:TIGR01777 family protein [Chloroflexota bacterium]